MIVNFASNYGSMTLASEPLKNRKKATPLDHTQIAYKASKAAVNMGKLASLRINLASTCIVVESLHSLVCTAFVAELP